MLRFLSTALLLILALCLTHEGLAQPTRLSASGEAESQFQKALARYIQGDYPAGRDGFQQLIDTLPPNQRTSAARLMLSKALFKIKDYSLAFAAAVDLYEHFPYSRYLPEADLIIGDCNFHQGQIATAAGQYARILTSKSDLRLKARAADRLGQMVGAGKLTDRDVERLKADFGSVEAAVAQFAAAAKKVEGSGWAVLAYEPIAEKLVVLQAEKHQNLAIWGAVPLLVCDVWEHAYYLQYQNKRGDWVEAFAKLANWDFAAERLAAVH